MPAKQKRNPNLKREKKEFKPFGKVLISHVDSEAHKNVQVVDLRKHYEARGHSIEGVEVEIFENVKGVERRKKVAKWIADHPEGAVYRSGLLTPCKTTGVESKPVAKPRGRATKKKG